MMNAFTRNYDDNSTEAGFQFTFYCDICHDGFKSTFIPSENYKKSAGLKKLSRGAGILGNLVGGAVNDLGWAAERSGHVLAERFEERTPEWRQEYERAFNIAQREAQAHFHRCHGCNRWVCNSCYNEAEGLCTDCAPREDIYVAKAKSEAMKRNIDMAAETARVWKGKLESKVTVCPSCGKPAGSGKFCSHCGASMEMSFCPNCGQKQPPGANFCNKCGQKL